MDSFGPEGKRLEWEVGTLQRSVDFLDLTVTITNNGNISTKTYQKKENTYLYRTPTSCQPPSILKSFIYGSLHRYFWQNTNDSDFWHCTLLLLSRLEDRGHFTRELIPLFDNALRKVRFSKLPDPRLIGPTETIATMPWSDCLFIHVPYHPNNPQHRELKQLSDELKYDLSQYGLNVDRIITAHSRAPNIGDICKRHALEGYIDTSDR